MKLKFLKNTSVGGHICKAGTVHEIGDSKIADALVKRGLAAEHKEEPPKKDEPPKK